MKKKFCIFSANYLPSIGGVEKYTAHLASALAKQGNQVTVVTSNTFDLPEQEDADRGVTILRLPCYSFLGGRLPVPKKNASYNRAFQQLKETSFDYVVVNTRFYLHSLAGIRFAETCRIKPVVIDHGSAHITMGNKFVDVFVSAYEHIITSLLKKHPADYYAVSEASSQWLQHFRIESQGILCNSINAVEFRSSTSNRDFRRELELPDNAFVVAFIGRLVPEKGLLSLIECSNALKDYKDIHFLFAGDGPLKECVTSENPQTHLLGALSSADIAALLLSADAFCLPSRSEGFATSLLESAACGTTPIMTNVGGVRELMPDDRYGLLLTQPNPTEIAKSILLLFNNRPLNKRMGEAIRQLVEQEYSWETTAKRVETACEEANTPKAGK